MKFSYYFNLDFNDEETKKVIEFFNQCSSYQDVEVDFYLCSVGGNTHCMNVVKNILEQFSSPISLVGIGELSSAAFNLFYSCNVPKTLLPNTYATLHTASQSFEDRDVRRDDHWMQQMRKKLDRMNEDYFTLWKTNKILSSSQLSQVKKGEDIIILYEDLHKIMLKCPYGIYNSNLHILSESK